MSPTGKPIPLLLYASNRSEAEAAADKLALRAGLLEIAALCSGKTPHERVSETSELFSAAQMAVGNGQCAGEWRHAEAERALAVALRLARVAATCPGATAYEKVKFADGLYTGDETTLKIVGKERVIGTLRLGDLERLIEIGTLQTQPMERKFLTYRDAREKVRAATKNSSLGPKGFRERWIKVAKCELMNFRQWGEFPEWVQPEERKDWREQQNETSARRPNLSKEFRSRKEAGEMENGEPVGAFEEYLILRMVDFGLKKGRRSKGESSTASRAKSKK